MPPVIFPTLKDLSCFWHQEIWKLKLVHLYKYNGPVYAARGAQQALLPPGTPRQVCCLGLSPPNHPRRRITETEITTVRISKSMRRHALTQPPLGAVGLVTPGAWLSLQVYFKSSLKHQAFVGSLLIVNGVTCKIFAEGSMWVEKHI